LKYSSKLNPTRRNTENVLKPPSVVSGADNIVGIMDITEQDSLFDKSHLKASNLTKDHKIREETLEMIEDKWEALLKDFDLNSSLKDGRIQSGKPFEKKVTKKVKCGERHTTKNELSFAFGERKSEKATAQDFHSFNLGSWKDNKLGSKKSKVSKNFNLEEEMRKINESYNITGLEKEKKKSSKVSTVSKVYTGNVKKKAIKTKDEKTKKM
jgi:hypothetical protein